MVNITATALSIGGIEYNLTDPAAADTLPTAWSPLTVVWGTADGLEPSEPTTLSCIVTIPPRGTMPAYGDRVLLDAAVGDEPSRPIFTGNVDGAERTARPDGSYQLAVTASDDLATLAKIRLADEPWPDEYDNQRIERIRQLVADRVTIAYIGAGTSGVRLAARDVDNFNARDALQLCIEHHTGERLIATRDGITTASRAEYGAVVVIPSDGTSPAYITDTEHIGYELFAYTLTDEPRALSIASVITHAAYTYRRRVINNQGEPSLEDATITLSNTAAADRYGDNRWSADTDVLADPNATPGVPDPKPMLLQQLQRILSARSREFWAMPTTEVLLEQWPANLDHWIGALISEDFRTGDLYRMNGAPPDVDQFMRVAGGELTLHADHRQARLTLNLEPETFAIPTPLTFNDLGLTPEATFDRFTGVTFADISSVSNYITYL